MNEQEELEARIAANPENAELRYQRAWVLEKLGRINDAKSGYLDALGREPSHFGAINNLGSMLFRLGFVRDATVLYAQAVKLHPTNPMGYINLGNGCFTLGEYQAAKEAYIAALSIAPNDQHAHHGLGNALSRLGETEAADRHFARAFENRPTLVSKHLGAAPPIRVLTLFDASMGNVHTRHFFDEHRVAETKLAVGFFEPAMALPPHDVLFNAIGDADRCGKALERAIALVARSNAPILNHPALVIQTRRVDVGRYANIPGVVAPHAMAFTRAVLSSRDGPKTLREAGFTFPLLVRAPGYHNGEYLAMVESVDTLAARAKDMPDDVLIAIEYLDTRSPDGMYRKYRVIIVGDRLYPLHLAISPSWKVHFFRADMAENAHNRSEDAAFLDDVRATIGDLAESALKKIGAMLGLDYAGIDFALDPTGNVVLFEANATMVVPQPPADSRWDYRRPHVARIVEAMNALMPARLRRQSPACEP